MRRPFLIVGVVIVVAVSAACAGPWRGQIVEAESGRPLEGVVILAYWLGSTGTWVTSHGSAKYRGAEEVVTGTDGRFVIPAQSALWGIPTLVIFKPGYGLWRFQGLHLEALPQDPRVLDSRQQKTAKAWERFAGPGVVIELPRLKTKQERVEMLRNVNWAPVVPPDKTTRLAELIKQEHANLWLH